MWAVARDGREHLFWISFESEMHKKLALDPVSYVNPNDADFDETRAQPGAWCALELEDGA